MADVAGHPSVSIFPLFLINIVFETAMQVTEMLVQTFYSSTWPCDPVLGNEMSSSPWGWEGERGEMTFPPPEKKKRRPQEEPLCRLLSIILPFSCPGYKRNECFSLDFFLPVKNNPLACLSYHTCVSIACSQTQPQLAEWDFCT